MVKLEALPNFSVASWAEVKWAAVRLLEMVNTHHQALVESAVSETEHVTEFMCCQLYDSHESLTLKLSIGVILLLSPLWHESVDAVNSSVTISITEAEVAEITSVQIHIGEANNSQGVAVSPLDWSNKFLQNVNSIVLSVVEVILFGINSESLNPVVSLSL